MVDIENGKAQIAYLRWYWTKLLVSCLVNPNQAQLVYMREFIYKERLISSTEECECEAKWESL